MKILICLFLLTGCGNPVTELQPTARCKDGTLSYSQHNNGTCSGHGGVAYWLNNAPSPVGGQ